ncbi:DUF1549 and DUF1553 domain-containing protein [Polystyrenella longa]|nr:DUF1549 and DUF1553 domain-containing protein [Polystyrenella longa]
MTRFVFLCGAILFCPLALFADSEPTGEVVIEQPSRIELEPGEINLVGARAVQQLVTTGFYSGEETRDLTGEVEYVSVHPAIAKVDGSRLIPVGNGETTVTAKVAGQESAVKVTVTNVEVLTPVSFKHDVLASLTKADCNSGACHGSPSGKGGFRLSLRGYDPPFDMVTLRTEYFGRRTNIVAPDESLLIKKPLMQVAHGGGRRLRKEDPMHLALVNWIGEGMKLDSEEAPSLVKIDVYPKKRILWEKSPRQQLYVMGEFSDGSIKDLTDLTVFSSSNERVAFASPEGLVEKSNRGETTILARYLDKMSTCEISFLEDVDGFAWANPQENNFIDTLAFAKMQQLQILPSELCSDEEFLRRAYLDVTGRLPRVEEATVFLNDSSADKRAHLIDQLLETPEYAQFWSLKWSDVLRASSKKFNEVGTHKFHEWIKNVVYSDVPLNQVAYELLTASGSAYENPAANYWRASREPDEATEVTAQLFLGIRIQCAKCHNHPFERWTQDNYYGLAATFARIGRKPVSDANEEVIFMKNDGEVTQPRTGETMKVHLLLKGDVEVPADTDRRVVFADWLTAADNPFFAKATVNRIWGHLMGRGIVDPVDDFRDSNPPSNAPLLAELTQQFVNNDFSMKWAIRTIMNSRLYQLSSEKNDFNSEDEIYHSHASTRLMTAEQLLDAICDVTGVREKFAGVPIGTRTVELAEPPADHYFLKVFGQPQREMACECERSSDSNLSQALQMINGPVIQDKLKVETGRLQTAIKAGKDDVTIINEIYLAAVSRQPEEVELNAALEHIKSSAERTQALEDVAWAVLNSKEFLFQH